LPALLLLCAACSKPEPKAPLVGWRPIGTWSGSGNEQTDSFNIESGQFRIKWEATNETKPGAGRLKITAHSGVSGRPIMHALDHTGAGKDTAVVSDEPRLYYLVIESSNVDWSLKVEEAVISVE
jgi:hypothetical protein